MRRRPKLSQRLRKRRMRLTTQRIRYIQACIDHIITGSKHQRMHTRHSSNLIDIFDTLDGLDLRDDAYVVVAGGDIVAVVGIQGGIRYARGEGPWAEGTMADGC